MCKYVNTFPRRVVSSTLRRNIVEGHIWFSVFVNHSQSIFTRLERISCCFSVVFLGMIANAMFFQTDDASAEQQ